MTRRLAVLVLAVLLLPAAGVAQRAARAADFLGLTRCEAGRPITLLREDVRDTLLRAQLEAHEAVHRAQAEASGSCEAFLSGLGSARRIIDVELPAYCAQWRVAVAQGAEPVGTRREYAWRIAAQSGAMENRLDVTARLERECPLMPVAGAGR